MKRLLLIGLLLIVGCSKEPINYETTLIERDGVYYTKDTNKPYSGPVFSLDEDGRNKRESILEDGKMISYKDLGWYWNGQKKWEKTYKDGEQDGLHTLWYENGKKRYEGNYKDGKADGLVTEWHENGQKKKEGTYKIGIKDGKWNYSTDIGNGKYEVKYTKGNIDLATFTDNLGQTYSGIPVNEEARADGQYLYQKHEYNFSKYPEVFATIKNGEVDGLVTEWHENGQKEEEGTYKNGKQDGLWTEWWSNGQKKYEANFNKDGELISYKNWDEDGNLKE